jgi:hypothetical protein
VRKKPVRANRPIGTITKANELDPMMHLATLALAVADRPTQLLRKKRDFYRNQAV